MITSEPVWIPPPPPPPAVPPPIPAHVLAGSMPIAPAQVMEKTATEELVDIGEEADPSKLLLEEDTLQQIPPAVISHALVTVDTTLASPSSDAMAPLDFDHHAMALGISPNWEWHGRTPFDDTVGNVSRADWQVEDVHELLEAWRVREAEMDRLEFFYEQIKQRLLQEQEKNTQLLNESMALRQEHARLQERYAAQDLKWQQQLLGYQAQIAQLEMSVVPEAEALRKQLAEKDQLVMQHREQLEWQERQVKDFQRLLRQTEEKLAQKEQDYSNQLNMLNVELLRQQEELTTTRKTMADAEAMWLEERSTRQDAFVRLRNTVKEQRQSLDEKDDKIAQMHQELQTLQANLEASRQSWEALLQQEQAKMNQLQLCCTKLEKDLATSQAYSEQLLQSFERDRQVQQDSSQTVKQFLEQHKARNAELEQSNAFLQSQLLLMEEEAEEAKNERNSLLEKAQKALTLANELLKN